MRILVSRYQCKILVERHSSTHEIQKRKFAHSLDSRCHYGVVGCCEEYHRCCDLEGKTIKQNMVVMPAIRLLPVATN